VRSVVRDLDPGLPIRSMDPMDEIVGRTFGMPRFLSTLLGMFGGMALLLMAAGGYGLVAFMVSQRVPEMGVRVALGAPRTQISVLILRDGLVLASTGALTGVACAAAMSRLIRSEVFGIAPAVPSTLAAVIFVVLAVVALACWLPARRSSRVDPLMVLKEG